MSDEFERAFQFPHEVNLRHPEEKHEAKLWLIGQFGRNLRLTDDEGVKWISRNTMWQSTLGSNLFRFRNPNHAFEFKMRWG